MKFNELPRGVFGIITLAPPVLMQSVDNQKVQKVNKKVPGDQIGHVLCIQNVGFHGAFIGFLRSMVIN